MKKLVFAALVALSLAGPREAFALSWAELLDDVEQNTKVTILKNASPVYLYNMRKGQSEGGIETNVGWYRFLSADIGWANPYDAGKKGTILGGASLHLDKMFTEFFPKTSAVLNYAFVPNTMRNFWDRLFVGFYFGRNIDESDLDYGIKSGLSFRF